MGHHKDVGSIEKHKFVYPANVVPVSQKRAYKVDRDKLIRDSEEWEDTLCHVADGEILKASANIDHIWTGLQEAWLGRDLNLGESSIVIFSNQARLRQQLLIKIDIGPDVAHQDAD